MTYAGEFNTSKINTVRIPSLTSGQNIAGIPSISPSPYTRYYSSTNVYSVSSNVIKNALIANPLVYTTGNIANIADGEAARLFTSIAPNPINGYYWNFSVDATLAGGGGLRVYKAPVSTPTTWVYTGYYPGISQAYQHIYVDANKVWLIGGRAIGGGNAAQTNVYSAPLSNLNNFTIESGGLANSASSYNSFMTVVGSKLYIYKANAAIQSANTSDPKNWTASGTSLPFIDNTTAQFEISSIYNDGAYIYLFVPTANGGTPGNPTIYRASYADPVTFSVLANNLPADANASSVYAVNGSVYIGSSSTSNVYKANSTLGTWTAVSQLNTPVKATHIVVDKPNNKIYAIGGVTTNETVRTTTIQSATLPNVGEWKTEAGATPPSAGVGGGEVVKTNNGYYIVGGNVTGITYRASLSNPLSWSAVNTTSGFSYTRGKCCFIGDYLYYFGGESVVGTNGGAANNTIWKTAVDVSSNDSLVFDWRQIKYFDYVGNYLTLNLPVALSRFGLIRAGNFIYLVGGVTSGPALNNKIYRANIDTLNFIPVGTINNPMTSPSVSIINNYVYLSGGGNDAVSNGNVGNYTLYASMSELANGVANFVEENTTIYTSTNSPNVNGFAEAVSTCIDDRVYFIGGRSGVSGVAPSSGLGVVYNNVSSTHALAVANSLENNYSVPTIDKYGSAGVYSSFQKTGYLPWLTFDSTLNIK